MCIRDRSLINKDRQTQDVLISSMIYNFVYNEIGKKDRPNPFYFNGKVELAGNIFSIFNAKTNKDGVILGDSRTIFDIPYSQFVKFDFDVRKYFNVFGNQTIASVSYTHLDVYKRQYYNIPDHAIKSIYEEDLSKSLVKGKDILCLLYTSRCV